MRGNYVITQESPSLKLILNGIILGWKCEIRSNFLIKTFIIIFLIFLPKKNFKNKIAKLKLAKQMTIKPITRNPKGPNGSFFFFNLGGKALTIFPPRRDRQPQTRRSVYSWKLGFQIEWRLQLPKHRTTNTKWRRLVESWLTKKQWELKIFSWNF